METSKVMYNTLLGLLKKGKRIDERGLLDYREIVVKPDISKNAEGSCEVRIGKTIVAVGVKIDIGEPFTDSPDEGILIVNAELLPLAYSGFEPGPPGIDAIELARTIDRGLRESGFIDLKALCLEPRKQVYSIFIDIYPLNYDGNLVDASFLASIIALKRAFLPKIVKENDIWKVEYGEKTKQPLPVSKNIPLMSTVYKLGENFFLDASLVEEKASDAKMSIGFTFGKETIINAIQKLGSDTITSEQLKKIIDLAEKGALHLKKFLI